MRKNKKILFRVLTAVLVIGLLYATTYFPKKIIDIEPARVSKIEIFNGNSGTFISVIEKDQIEHIILNLRATTFKKKGLSVGYMGYKYRLTIHGTNEKEYREFIVNSSDTIRYYGFFYQSKNNSIDDGYIDELFSAEEDKTSD